MKNYRKREEILFKIYELDREHIYNIVALSRVFSRFRKYRIALELLESALSTKDDDLLSVIQMINLYKLLNDKKNATRFCEIGESILAKHRYHKYKDRFLQLTVETHCDVTLLELMNTGVYRDDGKGKSIESNGSQYPLPAEATCNNKIKNNDRVYFATYSNSTGKEIYIDFIEPYFENLDNLRMLK